MKRKPSARNVTVALPFMINVYMIPNRVEDYPKRGGVREHLTQLSKHLRLSSKVQIMPYRALQAAHIQHVEATYTPAAAYLPVVYVCHGGFIPSPIPSVMRNLKRASIIITVADWLIKRFAPAVLYKTVTIPNGVDLSEFADLPPSGYEPGYVLYGKEWPYYFEDFARLCTAMPNQRFLTTAWPVGGTVPPNVTFIGLQTSAKMKAIIKDAGMVLLTGSEVCPTLMLEAWAAGTPVLAKAIDGNVELMRPYEHDETIGGMLYGGVAEAADYVNVILRHRNLLGEQGRSRVTSHHQWQNLVKLYESVYEQVLEPA